MSSCASCGCQVRPESRFCPQCGAMLRAAEARLAASHELSSGNYRIVRSLTRGGMGAVYLAHDRRAFDRLCVVKQMLEYYDSADPQERQRARQRFEEEGRTLASLSHPGIPKIYAFFAEEDRFYIVMEYIQGETLEAFITHEDSGGRMVARKVLPQEELLRYVIQVCRILEYLHGQARPVVHQDIKPSNIIVERELGHVRLVDFGTACAEIPQGARPGNGDKASIYGTDGYAAPELYRGKPEPRSDVFSLAATAYHLLTDDDPRGHPFEWPALKRLPRELALILERALRTRPEQRCTAAELRQELEALTTPRRALETFAFPGGARLRSVAALPAHCDEHWDAARSFLYNGDFQRWLRDINRLDLVVAADEIIKNYDNRDAGLEAFLQVVDAGLPAPKIIADPKSIDLGPIARESALIRKLTALNASRGYILARVSSSPAWLEVFPNTLHLWAGRPVDIRVNVRAEGLPFRRRQQGVVTIEAPGGQRIQTPVSARVSLSREVWRLTRRALGAAFPQSWRTLVAAARWLARVLRGVGRPFGAHPWLIWLVWLLLGAGVGAGLYFLPPWMEGLSLAGWTLQRPPSWAGYVSPVLLGPPLLLATLWVAFITVTLVGAALWGWLRGAWRSFFR